MLPLQHHVTLLMNQFVLLEWIGNIFSWIWDWKAEEDEREGTTVDAAKQNDGATHDKHEARKKDKHGLLYQ